MYIDTNRYRGIDDLYCNAVLQALHDGMVITCPVLRNQVAIRNPLPLFDHTGPGE